VGVLVTVATVLLLLSSTASASSSSWRYDQHGRNIDIDICIRCESPIPGPQGPPGPPGEQGPPGKDSNMQGKGVILTDTPVGHTRGWDPGGVPLTRFSHLYFFSLC
ncbi:MAG: hypothetical protein ACRD5J_15590, partial [Nitrososphaeraceae archaeon]